MNFQSSNIWIFIKISKKIWDGIFCHKDVDYRVCFSAWDRMEISYHYEVLLVGNFLSLKVELTVYISCPKECFLQGISYHSRLNFHLCIVQEQSNSNLPSCNKSHVRSMYTVGHTRDFNFSGDINQRLTYSHALHSPLLCDLRVFRRQIYVLFCY
jgi:hypothetical protein